MQVALQPYVGHRRCLADGWHQQARQPGRPLPSWCQWPHGPLFIGQRGPLGERMIQHTVAQVGQQAGLVRPLTPSVLHATFLARVFTPQAYGCHWEAVSLYAIKTLYEDWWAGGAIWQGDMGIRWLIAQIQDALSAG